MTSETSIQVYEERCVYQEELDRRFPDGAACAVLRQAGDRLQPAGLLVSTGRLFCSDARYEKRTGRWEHEILIDSRLSDQPIREPVRLWVENLRPHPTAKGLWEASIRPDPSEGPDPAEDRVLRVNANLPSGKRPTRRMRQAVTRAHEYTLFPGGIASC